MRPAYPLTLWHDYAHVHPGCVDRKEEQYTCDCREVAVSLLQRYIWCDTAPSFYEPKLSSVVMKVLVMEMGLTGLICKCRDINFGTSAPHQGWRQFGRSLQTDVSKVLCPEFLPRRLNFRQKKEGEEDIDCSSTPNFNRVTINSACPNRSRDKHDQERHDQDPEWETIASRAARNIRLIIWQIERMVRILQRVRSVVQLVCVSSIWGCGKRPERCFSKYPQELTWHPRAYRDAIWGHPIGREGA